VGKLIVNRLRNGAKVTIVSAPATGQAAAS